MGARITGVATYLPEQMLTSAEVERRIEGYLPTGWARNQLSSLRPPRTVRVRVICSSEPNGTAMNSVAPASANL